MIVGAGLAGLIAAHAFQGRRIIEASPGPIENHKALLRFRSDSVSRLTGIEFKPVTVRKGIWADGEFVAPNIIDANRYAHKCLGRIEGERSIWNIEPATRYIAPENFYEQLIEAVGARIDWGVEAKFAQAPDGENSTINTAPLPVVLSSLGIESPIKFEKAPITVMRYRIPRCDVYQTIYFPTRRHSVYRASITGDLLIVEFACPPERVAGEWDRWAVDVGCAFGLPMTVSELEPLGTVSQRYGKIAAVDRDAVKALLGELTARHGIFSLGRFATWRNILLDDVVADIAVVKRLIKASDYERRMQVAK